jgi:hypothetical protein
MNTQKRVAIILIVIAVIIFAVSIGGLVYGADKISDLNKNRDNGTDSGGQVKITVQPPADSPLAVGAE